VSEFHRLIEQQIPPLRRYARALTRNRERADDLVQDTLSRALVKEQFWQPGTNLRAWLFTIMHNQNVNNARRAVLESRMVDTEQLPSMPATTDPTASRQMFELERALAQLPLEQRQVIFAGGVGRHVLRGCSRNSQRSGRHGPLATIPRPRHSSQAFGYGGTLLRGGSGAGCLMSGGAGLVTYFTTRRYEPSGYLHERKCQWRR
jgi:RNA polymerase sigma factor (sigma-70 family)